MPDAPLVPPPKGGGPDARHYLESHGLVAFRPAIRSSDIDLALSSPLTYYLARRLGIVKGLRWSKALNRGTWMHHAFSLFPRVDAVTRYEALLYRRFEELKAAMTLLGPSSPEAQNAILTREERDARCAWAWLETALDIPISLSKSANTVRSYLLGPAFILLGFENRLTTTLSRRILRAPAHPSLVPILAQPDLMLFDQTTSKIWLVDLKSTDFAPSNRILSCPFEGQTQLYLEAANQLLKEGVFQTRWSFLPKTVTLGGMIHIVIQKPTIDFGQTDRNYTLDTSPLKSGPRKGLPRNERIYEGEPDFNLYLKRCRDWYRGEGLYADKHEERQTSPPIVLSFTHADIMTTPWWDTDFSHRIGAVHRLRMRSPEPDRFARPTSLMSQWGEPDPYAPFIRNSPHLWPSIMEQEGFVVARRDESHLTPTLDSDILPEEPLPS